MFFRKIYWLALFFFSSCEAIFENCDFYEELIPNRPYFVYSPEFPAKYPPGTSCRWYAVSPVNTKIQLTCEEFYIPPSHDCSLDRLGISRNGRIDLADVEYHCGKKTIYMVSDSNKINIVLLTVPYSPGGSFFCEIGVVQTNPPPTPPNPDCVCGYSNSNRIVGGKETGINEYPMMAALIDGVERELFCGATIISKRYALTAAHCLYFKRPRRVALLVGEHDISRGNDTDSARLYMVESFQMHPNYNSVNQKNDVGLVKVVGEMEFTGKVGPACLPFLNTRDSFAGETVYALGWGATEFAGPNSDKLLEAPLDVITLQQCKPAYGDLVGENQMCTYREDKDACQSDSGGPLLWRDPYSRVIKILGIISYGIQCATTNPSVNTRVTSYLTWIKDTTQEDFCIL